MNQQHLDSKQLLTDSQVLRLLEEQTKCNNMDGAVISRELRHYLYSYIDKIELKNNESWWDTLRIYPKQGLTNNIILVLMLGYRWKADEIHLVDDKDNYYKIRLPIQDIPTNWYIRLWWD